MFQIIYLICLNSIYFNQNHNLSSYCYVHVLNFNLRLILSFGYGSES